MQLRATLQRIPILGPIAFALGRRLRGTGFSNSADYWERRYRTGGTSGAGSYNRLAQFKADVLNDFVERNNVQSIIEFGSGDGAQLELANYSSYVGVDVSRTVVELAKERFGGDPSKRFFHLSEVPPDARAELALSLDVIYHLLEDEAFEDYMRRLFNAATRFVIIYSSNHDAPGTAVHVRHRCFTRWVEDKRPDFALVRRIANAFPFDEDDQDHTSFADFYIFERAREESEQDISVNRFNLRNILGTLSGLRRVIVARRQEVRELWDFLWLQRITGFGRPAGPHLDPGAMAAFNELLSQSNGFLEFGAGGSTLVADELGVRTLTIEGDRFYARTIRRALRAPSLVIIKDVDIGPTREWSTPIFCRPTRRRLRKWRRYSSEPFRLLKSLGWFPDFVLVDGRFRRACVLATSEAAVRESRPVTIMVDDYFSAGREHYQQVEHWLGPPVQAGRAALFKVDPATMQIPIRQADIEEAAEDYR